MDWVFIAISIWMMCGLMAAMMQMFSSARQSYFVNPLQPVWGAVQGPFALWSYIHHARKPK